MRWLLMISIFFAIQQKTLSQQPSSVTLETDFFTLDFPGIPEFECDTLQDSLLLVKHSYSFQDQNNIMYALVYRDRTEEDHKHQTFKSEIDWLSYWTMAEISEKKKGQLENNPTLQFLANTSTEKIYFFYILTKKHFIRIGIGSRENIAEEAAHQFFDSFKLKQ
ncbi:MAG: hypothetical protein ACFHU9_07525 [Fluviicola sp.]